MQAWSGAPEYRAKKKRSVRSLGLALSERARARRGSRNARP